ncbi:MAG: decaprenyl-phosphate phosphoribosyltransferase [Chloroflexi bacterium]|nr:decaprenyl-phosphate phosphoribosyltransferase [Chloroflexota bacterium]
MSTLKYIILSMRPKQWTKNLIIFMAFAFSAGQFWKPQDLAQAADKLAPLILAFVIFCLLSGSVYLTNDLFDLEKDRLHPQKRYRPLPSERLKKSQAIGALIFLLVISFVLSFSISSTFALVGAIYYGTMLIYSLWLKHFVIIDVFTIASGFILRAVAGAVAIDVPVSPWLYLCTILGSLFLGFNKRRHELVLLNDNAQNHRRSLEHYTPQLLDELIAVVTPSTVIAYSLYTFSAENLPQNRAMMLTIPFVLYGVFRYLYLVHVKNEGGSPEEVLLKDSPLLINIGLWLITAMTILIMYR